jgi:hypothetical protein
MLSKLTGITLFLTSLAWIAWCFLVVTAVVPAVLRKLTVYPGTTAWVLCVAPVIFGAVIVISRLPDEDRQ